MLSADFWCIIYVLCKNINELFVLEENFMELMTTGLMLVILVAFIFFNWRSSKKQQKEFNDMMDNLAVGDEVTLKCGLIGEIVSIREETITVVTSKDKTKVRFLKTAVMTVDVMASEK